MIKPEQFQEVINLVDTMNGWKKDLGNERLDFSKKKHALREIKRHLARLVEFYGEINL